MLSLMSVDDSGVMVYQAGEVVPAGYYARVDDGSYHTVLLQQPGPLPPSFDGHVALYRARGGFVLRPADVVETLPAEGATVRVDTATIRAH